MITNKMLLDEYTDAVMRYMLDNKGETWERVLERYYDEILQRMNR